MVKLELSGAYTAVVTPFSADASSIDFDAYEKLVESQIAGGISGLVPCGTTGERPTMTDSEQRELIQRTVAVAKGRVPVLANAGTNSTKTSIDASKAALEAGADAVMVVMPYYNKPSQEGMVRHVETIAKAVGAPIVLYNIPGRTGVELSVASLLRILDSSPNVLGVKDATGNVQSCLQLMAKAGDRVSVLSGDDPLTLPMMSVGAKGVISVTSNVYPEQVSEVVADAAAGRWEDARKKHFKLLPVHAAMFCEPNPAPVKAALAQKGRMGPTVRPPMLDASEACRATVAKAMKEYEAS